jgi:HlyD family secretion protein
MKKLLPILIPLAAAGGAVWWRMTPRPHPVKTARVSRGIVEATVAATSAGTVAAARDVLLRPEGTGRVRRILRAEGDEVKEGEAVVELDSDVLLARHRAALESVGVQESLLDTARTWERQAESDYRRVEGMWKDHAQGEAPLVSEQQYEEARWKRDDARARTRNAEAVLAEAKARAAEVQVEIDKATIRAPFAGRVTEMMVEVGETVAPTTVICEVQTSHLLEVEAPFDETEFGKVGKGMEARLTFDAFPGESVKGTVDRIAPKVVATREKNRTFTVTVAIPAAGKLTPGLSADVVVISRRVPDTLYVPTRCLRESKFVYVVEGGRAVRKEVRVGVSNWDITEVSGLPEGAETVSLLDLDFHGELDGQEVRVVPAER